MPRARELRKEAIAGIHIGAPRILSGIKRRLGVIATRVSAVRIGAVEFGHLRRLRPISTQFGFDRGKPIDRRYIEDFLSRNAADIRGRVLEVGDNAYTLRFGRDRITHSDILHADAGNPRATLVGDLTQTDGFPPAIFDCIVLTQTLQFIFDMKTAVATLHRMLKPAGVLLVTVPGISCIDREPNWQPLWTLSTAALRRLLGDCFGEANVSTTAYGNVLAAVAFLHGLAESELGAAELDTRDPQYPVTVAARAVRPENE